MNPKDRRYVQYLSALEEELVPAMGCTEPIAVALAAACAREALGAPVERVILTVSNNIIKNGKSVVVPNTGGRKGLKAAVAAGAAAGRAGRLLEVISEVTDEGRAAIASFLDEAEITVGPAEGDVVFDIALEAQAGGDRAKVRIRDWHTNIVLVERNGAVLYQAPPAPPAEEREEAAWSVKEILDFAETVRLRDVEGPVARQIDFNCAISEEGLRGEYGASIGRTLLQCRGGDVRERAKAKAASASDARMGGCELPVVITSGSGNQGITASVPVVEYARELGVGRERMLRAVVLSDLLTIHLKRGIGRLSAYCGAVSAGSAAGAAIAWLHGGGLSAVEHTLVNALAIASGIVCDGAKPSCAAKIACAVDTGIFGYQMYRSGRQFRGGDGIVKKGVENTIASVGRLGRVGMHQTDVEIVRLMTEEP